MTTEVKVVSDPKWKRLFFSLLFLVVGCLGEGALFIERMGLIDGRPTLMWWIYKALGLFGFLAFGFFVVLALKGWVMDPEEASSLESSLHRVPHLDIR